MRVDPAGNIFGSRAGAGKLPILLFGAHIDSVLHGGNYDGALGSLAAIEVIRALNDGSVKTRHPMEVVIWTNEGNHFGLTTLGSGVASGSSDPKFSSAKTIRDSRWRIGSAVTGRIPRISPTHALGEAVSALLKCTSSRVQIWSKANPIGIVQGIVGLKRWMCVVSGFANHAGTTPMDHRKDALAAHRKCAGRTRSGARGSRQVGTVGFVKVEPGAVNVIPGRTEFPVELRDLDTAKIDLLAAPPGKIQADRHGRKCRNALHTSG